MLSLASNEVKARANTWAYPHSFATQKTEYFSEIKEPVHMPWVISITLNSLGPDGDQKRFVV